MAKTDILLINPPYRSKLHIYMPTGLGYVATVLDAAGFKINVHDMNVLGTTPKDVSRLIAEHAIRVVGITGFITQVGHIVSLVNRVKKKHPKVKMVVGGTLLNGVEEYLFEECQVDVVVRGEAEEFITTLMHALLEGREIPVIPGVAYRDGDKIINNPGIGFVSDIDSLPMLNRDLFEIEKYIEHYYHSTVKTRTLEVIWSRGCPYKCVYCINSNPKKGRFRYRSIDKVIEEVELIKGKYGVNDVVIASEVFTVNRRRVTEFCDKIAPLNVTWSCFTRADLIDNELAANMRKSGCRQIFLGVEAADDDLLKKMDKKIDVKTISNAIHLLRKNNIEVRGGFISGLPWETPDTMRKARDFCINHNMVYWPSFSTAFPNTALYSKVKHLIEDEKKYIKSITNHHNFKSYLLNMTQMPLKTFLKLKNRYTAETLVETLNKQHPFIPKFLVYLGARVMLFFYHHDDFLGVDLHSLTHRIMKKAYVIMTFNLLKK